MRSKLKLTFKVLFDVSLIRTIKFCLIFLTIGLGTNAFAVSIYSQSTVMNLKLSNVKVEKLFSEIEKNSDYVILYKKGLLDNKYISVDTENKTAKEILDTVLPSLGLDYHVNGNQIVVVENTKVEKSNEKLSSQQSTVQARGTITDSRNEPLIGVSVVEKSNPTNGVATNLDGKFSLNVQPNAVLKITYMGYKAQEVKVSADGNVGVIILQEDAKLLDDVVVIGYGVQKKVNLTGAVGAIDAAELENRANPNVLASMQGKTPGVTIISRPGSDPSINIRGRGNLGTSSPLYVIDGVISDATFFANLDPNSIENISILKDAASASIYGSRAAYGVVLVTTKKGKNQKMSVTYDGFVGWKAATYKPKILSSEWYAKLSNEAARNGNPNIAEENLPFSQEAIRKLGDGSEPDLYPNTDWWGHVFRDNASITKHSLSFRGGTDALSYYSSFGYMYNQGFQYKQNTDRYNFSTNISADVKKWMTLRTGVKYMQDKNERESGSIAMQYLLQQPTTMVAQQSNGEWGSVDAGKKASNTYINRNPLRVLKEGGWNERVRKKTMYDFAVDIKPIDDLVVTGQLIYDNDDYKNKKYDAWMPNVTNFLTGEEIAGTDVPRKESKMEYDWRETTHMTYNALANYTWTNKVHTVSALAGMSYEYYKFQKAVLSRKNFASNSMTSIGGGSDAVGDMEAKGEYWENKMMSYFGRINYNYMDRYLLEVNMRADASSKFHKDHRWGYFPSFSAGWRVSEESFMKDVEWLDNLKFRASWGKLGSINNVGYYDYYSAYFPGDNYVFGDNIASGIYEKRLPNSTLSWEKVQTTDVGIDFDFLGNKINVVADYFYKKTTNILLEYNVAYEVGSPSKPSQNIASVENKGFELGISHNNRIGDFSYTVGGNLAYIKNKVTDLGGLERMFPDENSKWVFHIGQSIGTFYGYKTNGLLTQEDIDNGNYITDGIKPNAGDIKYVDLDDDGKLTEADKTFIGCDVPDFTYGINLNLSYKNFGLDIFGQGVTGAKVYFDMESAWAFSDNANPRKWHLKRWTEENPNPKAAYPRIYSRTDSHAKLNQKDYSDFWLFSANYFRIKNMTFSYMFDKEIVNNLGLQGLKMYFSMENPFTIRGDKRMKDFDPESASGRGVTTRGNKTFTFGVNISF